MTTHKTLAIASSSICTALALLTVLAIVAPCRAADSLSTPSAEPAPIRFLLSFDDGPSAAVTNNPTSQILDVLAHNSIQPGIKAIFFTQTEAANGGGSLIGRQLLKREFDEGHELAFHTATPHHTNHRSLTPEALELSLQTGIADLSAITGTAPLLVRPPFWNSDAITQAAYQRHGMHMLLTDLSANDGKIWGVNFSWHKRANMLSTLAQLRPLWQAGKLPRVGNVTPIVVTFHDVNTYTARNIEEYLEILIDVTHELDIPTTIKPFYDQRDDIEKAALAAAVREGDDQPRLPGLWNWFWK